MAYLEELAEKKDIEKKYDGTVLYSRLTSYQAKFLQDLSTAKMDIKIEMAEKNGNVMLNITDTYNGKNDLSARTHGIIRLPDYKAASKDFYPKQENGSADYLFTLRDQTKVKVLFKSDKTVKA